jgi:PAS domain S-box-containing protein
VIDPKVYLFPMIQRWPTPNETAETLLVRRDGSDVQFLNELRFHKNTALQLRFPLSRHNLPAARAALGEEGIVEGKDYRDVSVVAALRAVPDSPWFMVAKIDRKDIYGTIRKRLWLMLLVVAVCIGTTGTGILFFWQQEQKRHYSTQINVARELEASEERFRKTFSTSPEAIIIVRLGDSTLSSVNPVFSQTMGYQSEEVIGKTVLDLNLFRNYPDWEDMMKQLKEQGAVKNIEILLLKKDGQTLYSLLSGSLVILEGTAHVLLMARDITDHKTSEQALRDSEELYRSLFRQHAAVKLLIDQDTGNILDANDAAVIFYGWPHEQLIRMNLQDINALSQSEVRQEMEKVRAKKRMHFELRHRLADGSFRDVEVLSSLIEVKGRQSILSIIHDISDRKRTEAEIVRLNNELEQKVRERTAELSSKTVELERLNKVFVGRELRMRELKSRIKELKEKTKREARDTRYEAEC